MNYSQNDEQKHILQCVSGIENGRFLDIGAHDGVTFSNTRALWDKGWTGVYVEPAPEVIPKLKQNAGPDCQIVEAAIGTTDGKMKFFSSNGDMVGTLSDSHKILWSTQINFSETDVDVITIDTLKNKIGTQFDFINIDVEGVNLDVFKQFDWTVWKATCVCVEYERYGELIANAMKRYGYEQVYISSENIVFKKNV
jgi:FkbM family methyltransferase